LYPSNFNLLLKSMQMTRKRSFLAIFSLHLKKIIEVYILFTSFMADLLVVKVCVPQLFWD